MNKWCNGHSKQEIEAEFPVKGSRTSPLDSSKLWVEARNCFLVVMSKDREMQEMIWMQYWSAHKIYHKKKCKAKRVAKNGNQSQTQRVCFEVRATALLPAFTAVKGFHYIHRGITKVYRRPEYRTTPITILYWRGISTQEGTSTKLSTSNHTLLFTTSL